MPNFTSANPSIDQAISDSATYGEYRRIYPYRLAVATTAATTTTGSVTTQRMALPLTIPSVTSPVLGYIFPTIRMYTEDGSVVCMAALEYELGSLAVSGNTFTAGVAMPTKTIHGEPVQTNAALVFVVPTVTMTATTPVLTITYTDQDGNTGQTATITLPTNAIANSGFFLQPLLASGDIAIREVTNMSISTGSAGTVKVYGCIKLAVSMHSTAGLSALTTDLLQSPIPPVLAEAGDKISFYRFGSNTTCEVIAVLVGVPEV